LKAFCVSATSLSLKQAAASLGLLFLLFLPGMLAAQSPKNCARDCSCDMAGRVMDLATKQPLPYATIQIKGTSIGTIADDEGVFHLHNLCLNEFDLQISFVGYKTVVHHHDLHHSDPIIYLSPDDMQLESVVIEGQALESGHASTTISSINARELASMRGEKLGDVLSRLSGVTTLTTGQNVVKPVVHGLHSSRILIINNGVRHESQNWGAEHAPEIDPAMADNIRLIKGAAAVKYGPGALGGVIIIDPPQPRLTTPLRGGADLTLQSNGRSASPRFYAQQGYSNFAWVAQASGLYQGDLHAPEYQLTNTGARESSASAGVLFHKGHLDLNLHYSYFQQKLGLLRGSVVGNLKDLAYAMENEPPAFTSDFSYRITTPHQRASHHLLKLEGTQTFAHSRLHFQYGYQVNNRQELDVRRGTNNEVPSINLDLFTHSLDVEWQHPEVGRFSGAIGLQGQYQLNRNIPGTNTIPFLPNYDNLNVGLYMIESVRLGESILDAGLRLDRFTASIRGRGRRNVVYRDELAYHSITASLGLLHPLGNWSSFQTNLGLAWRPPNIAELYSFGKHETSIEYGMRRLEEPLEGESELSYKWVNTYSYSHQLLSLELTGYINYIQNYIYARPAGITSTVRGAFPFFVYDQTHALLSGLDASVVYQHSKAWASSFRGMLLHAADVLQGDRLVGIPPNNLSYTLAFERERLGRFKNFTTGLETAYVFKQYLAPGVISPQDLLDSDNDENEIFATAERGFDLMAPPEGYLLLHWSAGIERGRMGLRLGVRNLLNTSYRIYTNRQRYFADEPGRNFTATIKFAF
jgi:iron complex outermembrane recepter protein